MTAEQWPKRSFSSNAHPYLFPRLPDSRLLPPSRAGGFSLDFAQPLLHPCSRPSQGQVAYEDDESLHLLMETLVENLFRARY